MYFVSLVKLFICLILWNYLRYRVVVEVNSSDFVLLKAAAEGCLSDAEGLID